ncbi:MAG: HNH endonuclease [Planctomycetes bacterium]|nr:HNH endonuclease [Planctomycetota bacterium]
MNEVKPTPCALCGRGFPSAARLTKHHCLPKSEGGTSDHVELICSPCHGMIHATFTNGTLARSYATIADLRAAPELAAFIKWVRKQPVTQKSRNKPRKKKL